MKFRNKLGSANTHCLITNNKGIPWYYTLINIKMHMTVSTEGKRLFTKNTEQQEGTSGYQAIKIYDIVRCFDAFEN